MKNYISLGVSGLALAFSFLTWYGMPTADQFDKIANVGGTSNFDTVDAADGFTVDGSTVINGSGSFVGVVAAATTSVEAFTQGGQLCTLTDANGGTYTLTDAQMANCSVFEFAAGGAGQAVIALTMPATSTMTLTVPNAGDCRQWVYDASNLAAATTTTITAGTGHNIIAYTTNDDVIDGAEFAQITMCRRSNTDVNTFTTEMLNAD